jgi:hypothetical protein
LVSPLHLSRERPAPVLYYSAQALINSKAFDTGKSFAAPLTEYRTTSSKNEGLQP